MYRIALHSHSFDRDFEGRIKRDYGTLVYNDEGAPWSVVFINPDKDKLKVMVLDHWGEEEFKDIDEAIETVPDVGYKVEFPDFELDVEIPYGFRDCSWHNDVCPSWSYRLPDRSYLRIWIDYKTQAESEFASSPPDKWHRFTLSLYDHEFEHAQDLIHTNNWAEIEMLARFEVMKAEVIELMREGRVPPTVRSIQDLDDHCDTNALGGFCEDAYPTPYDAEGNMTEMHNIFHESCLAELSNWLRNLPADFDPSLKPAQPVAEVPLADVIEPGKLTSNVYLQVSQPVDPIAWFSWDHDKRVRFEMYQQLRKEFEKQP